MNKYIKIILLTFGLAVYSTSIAKINIKQSGFINSTESNANSVRDNNGKYIQLAENYKKRKSGQSAKEAAKDIPSWAAGKKPFVGESGSAFAKRLMDEKYPEGGYPTGPGSEYSKLKKYGDRAFE